MARQSVKAAVSKADIDRFVRERADFSFEMRVLNTLKELAFDCSHGGTFRDPITDKIRQFDIRASRIRQGSRFGYELRLAVECKNLSAASPLLIHSVPRAKIESFHELIVRGEPGRALTRTTRIKGQASSYQPGELVGKRTDQVSVKADGTFQSSDAEVFEKLSQAINSAHEIVRDCLLHTPASRAVAIVPLLVLPDDSLWEVAYSADGSISADSRAVETTSFFLDHPWRIDGPFGGTVTLSHLEIVTLGRLAARVEFLLGPSGLFNLAESLFD